MRLTLHTDYALRVLVHTGLHTDKLVTINDIASCYDISKNHLTKVVHQLGRAGYLETIRGKKGGIRLLVEPEQVRLGNFVLEIEEDFALARCLDTDKDAQPCMLANTCVAKRALAEGVQAFIQSLNRYTLAEMIAAEKCRSSGTTPCGRELILG